MSQKIRCPECQGTLKVWIDIDATLSFAVSSTGKLSKRSIDDNQTSDGRCGLQCQGCDWKIHGDDVEDKVQTKLIEAAFDQWQKLELSVRARK